MIVSGTAHNFSIEISETELFKAIKNTLLAKINLHKRSDDLLIDNGNICYEKISMYNGEVEQIVIRKATDKDLKIFQLIADLKKELVK